MFVQLMKENDRDNKSLPAQPSQVVAFICHLYSQNYAPPTILTYVSAVAFVNKIYGAPDPCQSFLVRKLLEGSKKLGQSSDTRLPITINILQKLIDVLQHSESSFYNRTLMSAMLLLAFHGFLRIGEITATSQKKNLSATLQAKDCVINWQGNTITSIDISIRNAKHSKGQVFNINIPANHTRYCPAMAIHNYLKLAKPTLGNLFQFPGGIPVTRSFFDTRLRALLRAANIDNTFYKGHSLRIGAATEAVRALGLPEHQVQKLGRWNSNAFKGYIRIPKFTSFK